MRNSMVFVLSAAALVLRLATPAYADAECKDLKEFIKQETAGAQKYVDIFTFRKNHRGDNVLLLFKDTTERGQPPKHWLFLNRPSPEMSAYCVMGRGAGFGQHDDKPELLYAGDFGPRGSGRPQCVASTPRAPAADVLRAFANRTLGGNIVLYTSGEDGAGFQFAIGNDQNWIIIQDDANQPQTSCFYDQGNDVFMRF